MHSGAIGKQNSVFLQLTNFDLRFLVIWSNNKRKQSAVCKNLQFKFGVTLDLDIRVMHSGALGNQNVTLPQLKFKYLDDSWSTLAGDTFRCCREPECCLLTTRVQINGWPRSTFSSDAFRGCRKPEHCYSNISNMLNNPNIFLLRMYSGTVGNLNTVYPWMQVQVCWQPQYIFPEDAFRGSREAVIPHHKFKNVGNPWSKFFADVFRANRKPECCYPTTWAQM